MVYHCPQPDVNWRNKERLPGEVQNVNPRTTPHGTPSANNKYNMYVSSFINSTKRHTHKDRYTYDRESRKEKEEEGG